MYKYYNHSVGNNMKKIQITTKCRYHMMRKELLKIYCKVAIEEACKRHKIEIIILKVLPEHAHIIVDCPRTMSDAKLMNLLKGFSSYLLFRICPNLRKRYPKGHFWNGGYFCDGVTYYVNLLLDAQDEIVMNAVKDFEPPKKD